MPPVPADFKNLIPGSTSALCEKLNKLVVDLSQKVYDWISFEYSQDGTELTPEYVALLCAANCQGGGGGGTNPDNPAMPAPATFTASDGSFSDRVRLTWSAVTPAVGNVSQYLLYRSATNNTDPSLATPLAQVAGNILEYDDLVPAGQHYNYWIRATNGPQTSAYKGPDEGYAQPVDTSFPAVTDLRATQGFSETTTGLVGLVFTAPNGTTAVDVFRRFFSDVGAPNLIHADVVCLNATGFDVPTSGHGVINKNAGVTEYTIWDQPLSASSKYTYFVKCKSNAPPRISPLSNKADGWVQIGAEDPGAVSRTKVSSATTPFNIGVPAGVNRMRVVLRGGGGAGGNGQTGSPSSAGTGGGAGATVIAELAVTPGETLTYEQVFTAPGTPHEGAPPSGKPNASPTVETWEGLASKLTYVSGGGGNLLAQGGASGSFIPVNGIAFTGGVGGDAGQTGLGAASLGFTGVKGASGGGITQNVAIGGKGGWAFGLPLTAGGQTSADGCGSGGNGPGSGTTNTRGWIVFCFYFFPV